MTIKMEDSNQEQSATLDEISLKKSDEDKMLKII